MALETIYGRVIVSCYRLIDQITLTLIIIIIIIIIQIYKAPMFKMESEALVRAASREMGESKTGNSKS